MGRLIYSALASLDGYVADAEGNFEWAAPDAEVHAFVNELERPVGTALYGRRMYEVLLAWETWDTTGEPDQIRDFATICARPTRSSTRARSRRSPARGRASSGPSIRPRWRP
jgi:dihydrofolate reductase